MNIKLSSLATRSTRPTGGWKTRCKMQCKLLGKHSDHWQWRLLRAGWREQEAGQRQSAQLTKRYPWCAGGVLEPCHGLQVSGHSTPAVSSVLICPPPAAWLPASHLPALCGEMGPVLPSHTALSSTLAAPHDIMLHTTGLYSAVTGHHSLASTLFRGRTQYPES